MEILNDSQWIQGADSISYTLGQGSYQWAQNVVNRGGILGTRQGLAELAAVLGKDPRGAGTMVINGITWMLVAIGDGIYKLNLNNPVAGLVQLNYPKLHPIDPDVPVKFPIGSRRMVHFELCVRAQKSVKVNNHGVVGYNTVQVVPPQFVMIIQDGATSPHYWDGTKCDKVDNHPDCVDTKPNNTPKGDFMKWVGDRLWVFKGRKGYASNLLNPFQNTEELVTASGGFFYLPDNVTAVGITHDFKSLLAFTNFTTSAFQVGLEDRTAWPNTQDFQRVIFPSIGCVSHRTFINMYGMSWWMSADGWVGLDNTLSAFQTSRLDVQDQNMSRSKEGINWSTGGGAAGSYGNFLFVSVPSANKWNQHTWVMDQAPINTLAGQSPPVWAANWTGIRPEQWITCQVSGHQRCFCISRDLTNEGHQATVWEAFIGQRMDVPKVNGERKAKDIGCAAEFRFMGLAPSQYMKLRWIELDLAEIVGDVDLQVYYCGRRTSYKKITSTHLTATVSNTTEEIFNPDEPLPVYVPQYRTVRSYTDVHSADDNDTEIQTPYIRNLDREFSVLVQWNGQMAVTAVRMAVDPEPDYMEGGEYVGEYLARRITAEGTGSIGCTLPPPNAPNGQVTSKFIAPIKPRWVEFPAYDSAVPNGVFFVSELTASPPPGDYPENHYPMNISLTSESQGIDIWFKDGHGVQPNPHPDPNHIGELYSGTNKPSITVNENLKARGFRDGMQPSIILQGQYTQSQVQPVVFDPPPGGFAPDEFPHEVPYNGPVGSYNFNEGSGTVVHDLGPYNLDGSSQHTTWNDAGKHGKALNFNGTTGYVALGNPTQMRFTGSSTFSAWVKAAADPTTGEGTIISRATAQAGWDIRTSHLSGQHRFMVQVASGNNVFVSRASSTVRTLNTWYHVTGVYNATAHTLNIYVNGMLDNGTLAGTVPSLQVIPTANVVIGRRVGTNYFNGVIDDLRVYNRALVDAEIIHDMNTAVTAPAPQGEGFPVFMTTATGEATIHFRTGASGNVTTSDPVYDPANPPHPHAGDTLRAKAFRQYYLPSTQTNGRYFAIPRCATPTCTPDGGAYPNADYNPTKTISIDTNTPGAQLRFTINDTDVEHGAINTTGHVEVAKDDTLRVIAQKSEMSDSLVKTATYTADMEQVETPIISPNEVILTGNNHEYTVQVDCSTPNVILYYEIFQAGDNINPTHNSPHVTDLPKQITVGPPNNRIGHREMRVLASRVDMADSAIASATFDHEGGD